MQVRTALYRFGAYVHHYLTAWNTGGEGIHSPYLFYIVRMLLYDQNAYYCFASIEKLRKRLYTNTQTITVEDLGTGADQYGTIYQRKIGDIAKQCLESQQIGQLLFRLVNHLGHATDKPLQIVELGTSFGITTAYLASAHSQNKIITFEGCPAIASIAQSCWQQLQLHNIQLVQGNINQTLYQTNIQTVDLAYIDANHTEQTTRQYFDFLQTKAHEKSIFIIDDIRHSIEMSRAWKYIVLHPRVTTTMDLGSVGIAFFDPHYLHCNYKLRI